jgi:hypothetical protein
LDVPISKPTIKSLVSLLITLTVFSLY